MEKFTVISHTHWDREWYKSFEAFRLNLVRLIDSLLEILKTDKDYIFYLDAQTVVIEDYLEIRPEKEKLLKKYIKHGNIVIGPWYLQNDFFLTDGEATVRNLKLGIEICEKMGGCSMVGYTPDQFGLISSLPKIFNGFGISSVVFGRGFMKYKIENGELKRLPAPTEFLWQCDDGSECIAVFLRKWYNNAQRISVCKEEAEKLLDQNVQAFENNSVSESILLMNGVDHLFPQKNLREAIANLQNYDIKQGNIDCFIEQLKENIARQNISLQKYGGNLLNGTDYEILKGCWSTAIDLKQANVRAQDALICRLEPLYTLLALSGMDKLYPQGELNYLWKKLLKLHPHDSICGCTCDAVHERMSQQFSSIEEVTQVLENRGMEQLAIHTKQYYNGDGHLLITLFNPSEDFYRGTVKLNLDFIAKNSVQGVELKSDDGDMIDCEILANEVKPKSVYSDNNPPAVIKVNRLQIALPVELCAFGYKTISARGISFAASQNVFIEKTDFIENGELIIGFDKVPYIAQKRECIRINNPIFIEDTADKGDSYVYRKCSEKPLVFLPEEFNVIENSRYFKTVEFIFNVTLPVFYDFAADRRSTQTKTEKIKVLLTLEENSDVIKVEYLLNNVWQDHRLRVGFNFGEGKLVTDGPFDFAERNNYEHCIVTDSNTHHNSYFAAVVDKKRASFELFTVGQHEVEMQKSALYLTILRATGVISRNENTFEINGDEQWLCAKNQLQTNVSGKFGLRYSSIFNPLECYVKAKQLRNGLMCAVVPFDRCEYSTGVPAVQQSAANVYYPDDDAYTGFIIDKNIAPFLVEGVGVIALKRDAKNNKTVVRIINYSNENISICLGKNLFVAEANLQEKAFTNYKKGKEIFFKPKQIKTLLIKDLKQAY